MAAFPVWRIVRYRAGDAPSREYRVRAPNLAAAKPKPVAGRSPAAALGVPLWTLR